MAEPVIFSSLLVAAFRLIAKRRIHFVFMAILGLIASLGYSLTDTFFINPPEEISDVSMLLRWLSQEQSILLILCIITFGISLLEAAIRGPLLLTLEETLLNESRNEKRLRLSPMTLLRSARTSFIIALAYIGFSALLMAIVFSPVILASAKNEAALPGIFQLSLLFFIVLSILFYYIKEFALFYALLGPVPLRGSLELGYGLFRKHIFPSLLFGLLLIGLSLIFTFILDSAIITIATVGGNDTFSALIPVFLLAGLFGVFEQIVRLLFFHNLAAPKRKERVSQKVTTPKEIPESVA